MKSRIKFSIPPQCTHVNYPLNHSYHSTCKIHLWGRKVKGLQLSDMFRAVQKKAAKQFDKHSQNASLCCCSTAKNDEHYCGNLILWSSTVAFYWIPTVFSSHLMNIIIHPLFIRNPPNHKLLASPNSFFNCASSTAERLNNTHWHGNVKPCRNTPTNHRGVCPFAPVSNDNFWGSDLERWAPKKPSNASLGQRSPKPGEMAVVPGPSGKIHPEVLTFAVFFQQQKV